MNDGAPHPRKAVRLTEGNGRVMWLLALPVALWHGEIP